VLVTFGPGGEDLRDLGPDAFLDDYADLPDLAERLLR
jgi:phosphoglycolate phosphatase